MIAIVLIGVMIDRPTLTLRTLTHRGLRRAAAGAAGGGASELPDVVCGDARAGRRLSARPAVEGRSPTRRSARALALWGGREIVGLILASLVAGLATTPYAAYPFPPARALRRDRQSARHAGRLGGGDADGHPRRGRDPVRLRRAVLAVMGWGIDWMIDVVLWVAHLPGAVGRDAGLRHRAAAARRRSRILLLCLLRTPLRWTGVLRRRDRLPVGGNGAAARCAGVRRRADRGGPRRRRTARHSAQWTRQLRRQGMARGRRRRARCRRTRRWRQGALRRRRLHRRGSRTAGCVSMVLALEAFDEDCAARRGRRQPARRRRRLRGAADRPHGLAGARRDRAALDRGALRRDGGAAAGTATGRGRRPPRHTGQQ